MFKVIVVLIGICAVFALFDLGGREERAVAAQYSAERNEAQDKILVSLTAIGDPAVIEFVRDWRKAAPHPTPEQLSELRILEQNIKIDKTVAVKYTVAWKEENSLCGQLQSVIATDTGCPPGL